MKRTRIDRLDLRLRTASAVRGQALAGELRRTLLPALREELLARGAPATREHLARVDVHPIRVAGGTPSSRTAQAVANAVGAAIDLRRRRG